MRKFASSLARPRFLRAFAASGLMASTLLVLPGALTYGGGGNGRKKPDTVPPTVLIASTGQTGTTLSVTGSASDNVGVKEVDVKIDAGPYQVAQGTTSWLAALDTSALAAGSHTVTARALDAAGNSATASTSISLSSPADSTPPTLSISAPVANATVNGNVTVAGSASDNRQVAKVELSVDGDAYQQAQGTTSWALALDSTRYANGMHTISARATDTAGNSGVTSESLNISNDLAPPSVAFGAPSSGANVSGSISVSGTASDDVSVARVELSIDGGAYQQAQGTTSWTFPLNTTSLANGSHTLAARATDAAGKTANASLTLTTSNSLPSGIAEKLITPEGVTITIASDVTNWTAQQIYDLLKPNAYELSRIGPSLTIEVQTQYASSTTTGVSGSAATGFYNFKATIDLDARPDRVFNSRPDDVLAHEYGHAWTLYHLYISHKGDWSSYLTARGIASDPRVDSTYNWSKNEMIADDYRLLFGTQKAQDQAAYINPDVPDPRSVSGLKDFFLNTWALP